MTKLLKDADAIGDRLRYGHQVRLLASAVHPAHRIDNRHAKLNSSSLYQSCNFGSPGPEQPGVGTHPQGALCISRECACLQGFLANKRQLRMGGLAAIELAQTLRQAVRPPTVSFALSPRSDAQRWPTRHGMDSCSFFSAPFRALGWCRSGHDATSQCRVCWLTKKQFSLNKFSLAPITQTARFAKHAERWRQRPSSPVDLLCLRVPVSNHVAEAPAGGGAATGVERRCQRRDVGLRQPPLWLAGRHGHPRPLASAVRAQRPGPLPH